MAIGEITGRVNIPEKLIKYTGKSTETANVVVDNNDYTISANVNVEEVTKDCASKSELYSLRMPMITISALAGERINPINTPCYLHKVRINLINFTEDNVGNYIYLYRKSKSSNSGGDKKKSYIHPMNYDFVPVEGQRYNKMMGYGSIAGTRQKFLYNNQYYYYQRPEVPDWMPQNGYIQTEWEITPEDIEEGYIEIDASNEFLSLLTIVEPQSPTPEYEPDFSTDSLKIIGNTQCMKFGLVDENKNLITLSNDTLKISMMSRDGGAPTFDDIVDSDSEQIRSGFIRFVID